MAFGDSNGVRFWSGAFLGAATAALAAAVATAVLVTHWEGAEASDIAPAVGLLAPLAVALSLGAAIWTWLLHGPSQLRLSLVFESSKRRQFVLLLGPFLVLGWFVVGQVALYLSTNLELPAMKLGLALGLSSLACLWGGGRLLELLATRLSQRSARPSLGLCIFVLLLSVSAGVASLVACGEPSGTGGPLALFGVLARDELRLEAALEALGLAVAAYVGALLGSRFAPGRRVLFMLLGLLVAAVAGFVGARGLAAAASLRFERSHSLAGRLLLVAQALSDKDKDGAPGHFGGADCDDSDASRFPGAVDVPGNGRDEDCSGSDAVAPKEKLASPGTAGQGTSVARTPLPARANVILLSIDTLRFDLGFAREAGHRALSPRLDQLAQRATVFERAYSLASYTSKSLGPALIGRYPSETARNFDHFDRFAPEVPFVQERLQKAGVHTVSVQGYWYFFTKSYGFERGWDIIDSQAAPRAISVDADASSNGDKVGDRLLAQLDALKDAAQPFFLWGHWVDPHAEYVRHEKYEFGRESRDKYDGEVAFVDEQIGRVLDAVAASPQASRTIVIVTSDHGEAFGEHGLIRHGFEVWEELVHVPLLVYVPGAGPKKIGERRSLIDLTPTLLDALSVSAAGDAAFLRGRSLLDDVLSQAPPEKRPVFVDMPQGPHNKERRAFYSGDHKLISSDGRVLGLYDLKLDPDEKKDLSEDEALVAKIQAEQASFLGGLQPLPARH